jgi:hypothetical protein
VWQSIEKASGVESEITMTTLWRRRHHLAGATLWHRRPHLAGAAWQIKTSSLRFSLGRSEIEQILKAVGTKFVRDDVNCAALAEELRLAFRQHDTRQQLERDDATERQVREEIESIMAQAKRLYETLAEHEQLKDRAARLLSAEMEQQTQSRATGVWGPGDEQVWSLGELRQGLEVLAWAASRLLERERLAMGWRAPREPMANYWLMGKLTKIYSDLVGRTAFGIARSDRHSEIPGGPGIRFVQAVLEIAGLKNRDGRPWGPQAIEKAWRQRRRGDPRRAPT